MSNRYALLIGVDFYFEYVLPDGVYYPSLGGCVRDIRHVEAYLTDPARLNMPRENVLMLTSSDNGSDMPVEPPEQWPTYANIVAKLKALTDLAQEEDQVYIQYSGHGGRAATIFADLKGDDGLDECLVPLDIGDPQAQYVRDVELYFLIDALVKKGVRLTVVFDCCNSGGATRGVGGAVKRGIGFIDSNKRPNDSLVATTDALTAAWQQASGGVQRAAKPASGWLLEPKGYTFVAACRANESAFEYPFNGTESNGALTYWMLDTLRRTGPTITYKTLHDRVLAKVHGQFEQQTPMLQGEANRRVFGSNASDTHVSGGSGSATRVWDGDDDTRAFGDDEVDGGTPPIYTVPVLQIDQAGKRLRLNAGEVHGITLGTQFAIYPFNTTDFEATASRLAVVETDHVNAVDAWAKIIAQSSHGTLEEGAQALLLNNVSLRTRREVALVIDDAATKQQLADAITAQGNGFITVAGATRSDFQVAINADGQYELWDAAGAPIPNLRPPISVSEPNAIERVVQRLVHLTKYYNVRDLTAADADTAQKLRVTLVPLTPDAERDAGGAPIYTQGDKVKMTITNLQSPGAANDPSRILNITVLDLAPDWSITQIFPAAGGAFEPLDPGGTFEFEFEAYLPSSRTVGVDTFKVFATQATTNFRWLQLTALDEPRVDDAIQRAAIGDPLEQLLATITGETLTTRDVRITSSPKARSWTTAQVDLRVEA